MHCTLFQPFQLKWLHNAMTNRSTRKPHQEFACWYNNSRITIGFFEILASTYDPGPYGRRPYPPGPYGPEPLIILQNIHSQISFRVIIRMHTTPGACLLYVPGALCISNMVWQMNLYTDKASSCRSCSNEVLCAHIRHWSWSDLDQSLDLDQIFIRVLILIRSWSNPDLIFILH